MDERDCPVCQTRMEEKGSIDSKSGSVEIWQCPNCKNVEILYGDD